MSLEKKPLRNQHSLALAAPRDDDWAGLVARIARGDTVALADLYDRSAAPVHGLVVRILGDVTAAEDVTLDVYVQVWREAARFDADRGSARSWVFLLARSRAIDHLRRTRSIDAHERAVVERTVPLAAMPTPEESAVIGQRRRIVERACARLAAEQRHVIELAYFGGLSHSEIATTLGEPLGTVKTRIRAGMQRLRDDFTKMELEPW